MLYAPVAIRFNHGKLLYNYAWCHKDYIAVCYGGSYIYVFKLDQNLQLHPQALLRGHKSQVIDISWGSKYKQILSISMDNTIYIWVQLSPMLWAPLNLIKCDKKNHHLKGAVWSPKGDKVVVYSDGHIAYYIIIKDCYRWDVHEIKMHKGQMDVIWDTNDDQFMIAMDDEIQIYQVNGVPQLKRQYLIPGKFVTGTYISGHDAFIIITQNNSLIEIHGSSVMIYSMGITNIDKLVGYGSNCLFGMGDGIKAPILLYKDNHGWECIRTDLMGFKTLHRNHVIKVTNHQTYISTLAYDNILVQWPIYEEEIVKGDFFKEGRYHCYLRRGEYKHILKSQPLTSTSHVNDRVTDW